jgi:DNA polymerase III epsilon subunit-like protein
VVFDFETSGLEGAALQPIQIAAVAISPYNLEYYMGKDRKPDHFESLMRPTDFDAMDQKALDVNKKTREELREAPLASEVMKSFATWCSKYNKGGKSDSFSAPIPCGYNILGFDMPLLQSVCETYGLVDKKGKQSIFNTYTHHDVMDYMKLFFHGQKDLANFKFDTVRQYFGMSKDGAHDAYVDVVQTGEVLIKFMKLCQAIFPRVEFKDCFKNEG